MKTIRPILFGFRKKLTLILQNEASECGLSCVAMVAGFYGHRFDLNTIRRRFNVSLKGMTLSDIIDISSKLFMCTRAVRLELEELSALRKPCILHWDLGHFVVLDRVTKTGAIIHDPAIGRRHVTLKELDRSFTGVALELWPSPQFQRKTEIETFPVSQLFKGINGFKIALLKMFSMALCLEVMAILSPLGLQMIIDQAVVSADLGLINVVAIGLLLTIFMQAFIDIMRSIVSLVLSTRLAIDWRAGLFLHLMKLPMCFFEKRHVGDIVSRFGSLRIIQSTLTSDTINSVIDGLMSVSILVMMLFYSPILSALSIITAILFSGVRLAFHHLYRRATEDTLVYDAREQSHFMETIRGISSIKGLSLENRRLSAWLNTFIESINAHLKTERLNILFKTINSLLFGISRIIMLWLGAKFVVSQEISLGMLMAFSAYQEQFSSRISRLIDMSFQLKMLSLHKERLSDIALSEPEIESSLPEISPSSTFMSGNTLKVENLSLRYGDGEIDVLRCINLSISEAENIVIVGQSGCGKTTLLKCISGLLKPTEGRILFGDRDINDLGLSNYRKMISCVLQEDRLFAGTLADNISGFDPKADQGWIEECARMASIEDEIRQMPMGYESFVGDMGSILSGGQKQRVVLARALYRRPRILFLDEATSHLDVDNEKRINEVISEMRITRIAVAHRASTIAMSERIIYLSGGNITTETIGKEVDYT
ncbi:putative ABC transport protein, ATP-binding component [Liberibacter crescens BT-1]|uniref:Putative ABC transport protein, ATP-binding component n=1 Tax=Liberibacter crescens (strain BT-1) TaxID=1215343 RepID=L0EUH2_LIBCB|nr:peptidase domain-containing ABC transporter [Liberibacter crescens]AGA65204.1 putative ABC transport protein, ATP-binding component [Liberibacter crescens BT-1]AMC13157.1 ABC transporter [Liberibacter crescens]